MTSGTTSSLVLFDNGQAGASRSMILTPPARVASLETVKMEELLTYLVFLAIAAAISVVFYIIYR